MRLFHKKVPGLDVIENKTEKIDINEPFDKYDAINFFDGLSAWEPEEKVSFFKRIFSRSKNKYALKTCVFVADNEEPVIKKLPIDPNSQLLHNPDTGEVYLRPMRGNIYFFDKYKCLPLSECPNVEGAYDLPEHLALKFYNLGFGEAELSGYKDLISKINKWQATVTIALFVALAVTAINAWMFKTNADQVDAMQTTVSVLAELYGK